MEKYTTTNSYIERLEAKERASLTVEECVERADKIIDENGVCLLLMDMIESRNKLNSQEGIDQFIDLVDNLSVAFEEYLPQNNLTALERVETGFNILLGDGMTAGINNSEVIPLVDEFITEHYPDMKFRYGVAIDGFDKENVRLIK